MTMAKNKMDRFTIVSALILLVPCLLQQPNTLTEAFSPYQCFIIHNHSSALTKESFHRRVEGSLAAATKDDDDGKKQNQRRPWDILRFVSQSSKFIRPPSLPQIIIGAVAGGAGKNTRKIGPGTYYFCTAHSNALPYLFLVNNNLLPLVLVLILRLRSSIHQVRCSGHHPLPTISSISLHSMMSLWVAPPHLAWTIHLEYGEVLSPMPIMVDLWVFDLHHLGMV